MMAPLPGAPGAAHLFLGGLKLPDSKNIHFYPPCSWYLALNTGVSFCYNRVDNTMLDMSVPGGWPVGVVFSQQFITNQAKWLQLN